MGKAEKLAMTSSPSRGLLYPTPPEYDVFKTRRETEDEIESAAETDAEEATTPVSATDSDSPMMTRANWTGTVPADD